MYFPASGFLKSFSEGRVTINPPAMSLANLAISKGNLVTLCLQIFDSKVLTRHVPEGVVAPSDEHAIPQEYMVSFK